MGNPNAEARQRRGNAVLVIVKNDPESAVAARMAKHAGIMTIVLVAKHMGISLDEQPEAFEQILRAGKKEVWTFELPGPKMEADIARRFTLRTIDHHEYTKLGLDRTCDEDGNLRPSALEQFLDLAGVDDDELRAWGYNPRTIRGIGYFDAKLARGLRERDYTQAEFNAVLELREQILRQTTPRYDETDRKAAAAWQRREQRKGYWFVQAGGGVANAMLRHAIADELDEEVLLVSAPDELVITVRHVSQEVIAHLNAHVNGHTFVFGTRNCWGVDNRHGDAPRVSLAQVRAALETAPL